MALIKILVCGGRDFEESEFFKAYMDNFIRERCRKLSDIEIISGGCRGTDKLAEQYALDNGYALRVFAADWKQYGRAAGPIRNRQMINYLMQFEQKYVIAFVGPTSKGTLETTRLATNFSIPVFKINYETNDFSDRLYEGVTYNSNTKEFSFDWLNDRPEDIVHLTQTKIGLIKLKNKTCYYGYKINAKTDKKYKDSFLQFIKDGSGDLRVNELVNSCIKRFYASTDIKHFDYVCKLPSHSHTNELIVDAIKQFDNPKEIELVKKPAKEFEVDWDAVKDKIKDKKVFDNFYKSMDKKVNAIKNSSYFSSRNVPPLLKDFTRSMINLGKDSIENSENTNLLLVDDIVTTGKSLNMVLQLLDNIDFKGTITILTLIANR